MNMEVIFGQARRLRALISLDRVEFARLEEGTERLLASERAERRHDGQPHQRAFGAGDPVVYLGSTSPGSVRDKKLAHESELCFPPAALVLKETGFQGYEPLDCATLQSKKKPRGRTLHSIQKTITRVISRVRGRCEHAICGIKRCHIVADLFRNRRCGFDDEVMLAASGLHNLRMATWTMAA